MLSFAYALLVRDTTVACLAAGLDPQIGLLHRPRHGRPSLALDLAEEFRPLVGDSTVVTAINNGEVRPRDFVRRGGAVALTDSGRKRVIAAYDGEAMVGFARTLSDGVGTAYLADVFVLPEHRGGGLAQAMLRELIDNGPGAEFRWMLHTADAHGLYAKLGFAPPNDRYLERPSPRPNAG